MDYKTVVQKISDNSLTVDDMNAFIMESLPAGVGERVRRRTRVAKKVGIDNDTGNSRLSPMNSIAKHHPKRKPTSSTGGNFKSGHDASTRTQQRRAAAKGSMVPEGKLDKILDVMTSENLSLSELHDRLNSGAIDIVLGKKPEVSKEDDERT